MAEIRELVEQAIAMLGSEAKLARAIGLSQPTINDAKHKGRVTARLAAGIHKATNGQVSRSALRPDLWPPEESAA